MWNPKSVYLLVSSLLPLFIAAWLIATNQSLEYIAGALTLLNSSAAVSVGLFGSKETPENVA